MTDFDHELEIIKRLRRLIETLKQHPPESAAGKVLRTVLPDLMPEAVETWLIHQQRNAKRQAVFSDEIPGFYWIGEPGREKPYATPDLSGLPAAHAIFLHGPSASLALNAASLGFSTPSGLRNALERAAEWAEPRCPALAVAIRGIKVDKAGGPSYAPDRPVEILLRVFSTYSGGSRPT